MEGNTPFYLKYMTPARAPISSETVEGTQTVEAAPSVQSDPPALDFSYVGSGCAPPADLAPSREWQDRLVRWFSHLRLRVANASGEKRSLSAVRQSIENGELPRLEQFGELETVIGILKYFDRKRPFGKCELTWLFACLIFVDRLVNGEVGAALERIYAKLAAQITAEGRDCDLYSYLSVCLAIIGRFFHKETAPSLSTPDPNQ
jgi:hypothetical protein